MSLSIGSLARQLRLHQWIKSLLIFVPVIAAHRLGDSTAMLAGVRAFVAFGCVASAVYVMNDIFDLEADRSHPRKKHRPLAAGEIGVGTAASIGLILVFGGFTVMMGISSQAAGYLGLYLLLNIAYSRLLKEFAIVDVLLLASFYTLRILVGGAATGIVLTPWLLAFAMFVFFSLALAKRVSELQNLSPKDKGKVKRRGYQVGDLQLLTLMGASAGQLAVLVFALYISGAETAKLYASPHILWYLCLALFYWNARLWLSVHRGELNEDPVIFTLRDPGTYAVTFIAAAILFFAAG